MIRPARMKKIKAFIHIDYVDPVIRLLGEDGRTQLIDLRTRREAYGGDLREFTSDDVQLFKITGLTSRVSKLTKALRIPEVPPPATVAETGIVSELPSGSTLDEAERIVTKLEQDYEELAAQARRMDESALLPQERAMREKEIAAEIDRFKSENASLLSAVWRLIQIQKRIAEAKLFLLRTKRVFYLEGWVPDASYHEVVEKLEALTSGNIALLTDESSLQEKTPTLLRNPSFLQPIEKLVSSYGLPEYRELDPTFMIALTFPLFFGLMFADIGQGALFMLFGLFILLYRKKLKIKSDIVAMFVNNAELFVLLGFFAIIGGLIFGELFGYHLERFGIEKAPLGFILEMIPGIEVAFNPVDDPMKMFKLSLLIGVAHITVGLVFSFVNKILKGDVKRAIFESAAWIWFYIAFIYFVFAFKFDIDLWFKNILPIGLLLGIPLVVMVIGKALEGEVVEGIPFILEVAVSSIGNTISYGRILALNLSHTYLSSMFVMLGEGQSLPVQMVLLVIGTLMVLILEGLIVFVHTLRLHWVEWFSKFHAGEGAKYSPFRLLGMEAMG